MKERGLTNGYESLPLSGIRVVDFTTTIAGPSATRHLADFGAQVIKVESSVHPDTSRLGSPYAGGVRSLNTSGYFSAYNAGKHSLALNLRCPGARDLVRRLVEVSDVVVEAFTPGVMARWGLAYDTIRAWNPRIIMASHSLQGQSGPRSGHRGFGQLASALSGWFDLTGLPDEQPVGPYSAYTDFIAWPVLFSSILLALELREESGEGWYIDHSHIESSAYFAAPELLAAQIDCAPSRNGNRDVCAAPNNTYPCHDDDRWCAITVRTDAEWGALCKVIGATDLGKDPRFRTHQLRKANEDALDAAIGRFTVAWDAADITEALASRGVAAGVVYRAEDLFTDPQLQHRNAFRRLDHPELGVHSVVAPAIRIEGVASGPARGFPLMGEHTIEVCRDMLGLSEDEIADYAAAGVFE